MQQRDSCHLPCQEDCKCSRKPFDTEYAPAKLPVRVHSVEVRDGDIYLQESDETPKLPPGLTIDGHAQEPSVTDKHCGCIINTGGSDSGKIRTS